MDMTFIYKLVRQNNGVKYLVGDEYIFEICQSSNCEIKVCQRHFTSFQTNAFSKNIPEKLWFDKRTKYGGTFKKRRKGERH